MAYSPNIVFETRDLNICQGDAVEIHPAAWDAVAMSLSTLSVRYQSHDLGFSQARGELVSLPHARLPISQSPQGPLDNATPQHAHTAHGNVPHATRHAPDAPSGSSNETTQSENDLSAPATSYDDVRDSMPTDFAEEELGSYEDEFEDTPAPPKGKGKTKASARARIESDAEDEDEHGDYGRGTARAPAWLASLLAQNTTTKTDPSFSILPVSPPKRAVLPSTSPQRVSVHSPVLFSPRVKLGVNNSAAPPVLSDDEPRKPVPVVPDTSLRTDGPSPY